MIFSGVSLNHLVLWSSERGLWWNQADKIQVIPLPVPHGVALGKLWKLSALQFPLCQESVMIFKSSL
jgi:hypothetical protein